MKIHNKIVESSLGIKTTEEMARKIDSLLPSIPQNLRRIVNKSSTETELAPDLRTDISTVTTSQMDRDQEIVIAEGINLDEFRINPIVLYEHNYALPTGKCLWIKPIPNGLSAKTQYPERPQGFVGDWLPDFVYGMIAADVLKGKSIGFLPVEYRDPTDDERAAYPQVESVITNSLLVEYSCVAVPCNAAALVEAINKGITKLCSGMECFEKFKIESVGMAKKKVKAQPKPVKLPTIEDVMLNFNIEEIVEEVLSNVKSKWEV